MVLDVVFKVLLVCRFHKVLSFLRDIDPTSQCTTYPHCSYWAESGKVDWSTLDIWESFWNGRLSETWQILLKTYYCIFKHIMNINRQNEAKLDYRLFLFPNSSGPTGKRKNLFRFCNIIWINVTINTKLKNATRDWKSHARRSIRKDKLYKIENRVEFC